MNDLLKRITIDPERMHGRPSIRGLRITVADVLGLLSVGQSREDVLKDYPYLEDADIDAVLAFAALQIDHPVIPAE
ncbi:MAG: DUF433 domain-containing protein [Hyphomicrobiales bacterium]|jgi:uncharacterized protein (DUF433 family)|nr:DUF433 domain-containing protein [Hyphomicrobiales bacterium]